MLSPSLDRVSLRNPVFISDLHLCSARPRTVAAFHALLRSLEQTGRPDLVILGDLFEFWAGDDTLAAAGAAAAAEDDAISARVAQQLKTYAQQGGRVFVMHGNRDLLLGTAFCEASGAQRLADPCIASFDGAALSLGTVMLSHGDAYCTLDLPYQAFRQQARNPQFQAMFLTRSLTERRAMLGQARKDRPPQTSWTSPPKPWRQPCVRRECRNSSTATRTARPGTTSRSTVRRHGAGYCPTGTWTPNRRVVVACMCRTAGWAPSTSVPDPPARRRQDGGRAAAPAVRQVCRANPGTRCRQVPRGDHGNGG